MSSKRRAAETVGAGTPKEKKRAKRARYDVGAKLAKIMDRSRPAGERAVLLFELYVAILFSEGLAPPKKAGGGPPPVLLSVKRKVLREARLHALCRLVEFARAEGDGDLVAWCLLRLVEEKFWRYLALATGAQAFRMAIRCNRGELATLAPLVEFSLRVTDKALGREDDRRRGGGVGVAINVLEQSGRLGVTESRSDLWRLWGRYHHVAIFTFLFWGNLELFPEEKPPLERLRSAQAATPAAAPSKTMPRSGKKRSKRDPRPKVNRKKYLARTWLPRPLNSKKFAKRLLAIVEDPEALPRIVVRYEFVRARLEAREYRDLRVLSVAPPIQSQDPCISLPELPKDVRRYLPGADPSLFPEA